MAEQQQAAARLHEIAQLLRGTHHLGAEEQRALAELADELGNAWALPASTSAATPALAERVAHLAEALKHGQASGPLHGVRQRMEEMAAKLEGQAPNTASFARQLVDALAGLGI
ncbi:MAG TPA: hypothetical protein VE988_26810 [Gemmataceae bacterium]|nr:hypothetical protein [Gemmataceae bacterium]